MQAVKGLWIFYKKLIVPAIATSTVLAVISVGAIGSFFTGFGIAYIFLAPLFHFIIYEVTNPKEYYFYYNLGLSRISLWTSTWIISLITGLIFMMI